VVTFGYVTKMAVTPFDPQSLKTTCYANFTAPSSMKPELPIEVLRCGKKEISRFFRVTLTLTFVYNLDPFPLKMLSQTENELST